VVANSEVTPLENFKGNRRSFTAFRMTLLWVEEVERVEEGRGG
jgi:hypothetical protein